jgi:hypothetical protein
MPNTNPNLKRNAAFYHSLGKVITESNNLVGNEKYKSAHNVRTNEIWSDSIPFAPTYNDANNLADGTVVLQLGTTSNPSFLYPLTQTNYQTWFIDNGTPTAEADGFTPSIAWVKSLINPSDVTNEFGDPSEGYKFRMFRSSGEAISYDNSFYDVDYFAGLIRFQEGNTPIDPLQSNGLGFSFDKDEFESLDESSKVGYITDQNTGGIRGIAFQYVGTRLSDFALGGTSSGTGLETPNLQKVLERGSNAELLSEDLKLVTNNFKFNDEKVGATSEAYLEIEQDSALIVSNNATASFSDIFLLQNSNSTFEMSGGDVDISDISSLKVKGVSNIEFNDFSKLKVIDSASVSFDQNAILNVTGGANVNFSVGNFNLTNAADVNFNGGQFLMNGGAVANFKDGSSLISEQGSSVNFSGGFNMSALNGNVELDGNKISFDMFPTELLLTDSVSLQMSDSANFSMNQGTDLDMTGTSFINMTSGGINFTSPDELSLSSSGIEYSNFVYDSDNAYLGFGNGTESSNLDTVPNYFSLAFDSSGQLYSNVDSSWVKYLKEGEGGVFTKENDGYKLTDRIQSNYLTLGSKSIDLTLNDGSILTGASGDSAFAFGPQAVATGINAASFIYGTASGESSFIYSGFGSEASGYGNVILSSEESQTSNTFSAILSTFNGTTSGYSSTIISSFNVTASGLSSTVIASRDSDNNGIYSLIGGGESNTITNNVQNAFISGAFNEISASNAANIGRYLTSRSIGEITVGMYSIDVPRIGPQGDSGQTRQDIVFKIGAGVGTNEKRNQFYVFKSGLIKLTGINIGSASVNPNLPEEPGGLSKLRGGFGLDNADNVLKYHNGTEWISLGEGGGSEPDELALGTNTTSGTVPIVLDNSAGTYVVDTEYINSEYEVDVSASVLGGNMKIKYNTSTKPTVSATSGTVTEADGSKSFVPNQVQYLYIENTPEGVLYFVLNN